jgi:micrococcal nuclease
MTWLVATLGLLALVACSQVVPESPTPPESGTDTGLVVRVIDGDTVEIERDGSVETVRYIGIDATESGECFSAEATARNSDLVLGVTITLETDTSDRDQFGQLLRYAYLPDGRMVNEVLVKEGYAGAAESEPNTRYSAVLRAANDDAKDAGIGWWETCANAFPRSTSPRRPFECDPAYPTICLPPAPPDLDCDGITERGFIALHPDPHRLDSDGDGIACEG